MRSATIIGLGAAAIVAAAAAVFVVQGRAPSGPAFTAGAKLLPELGAKVNDVALVEVKTVNKGTFTLKRDGETWVVPEKGGYPAKADRVKKTILGLAEMSILEPRTENPELYARIGVQEPGTGGEARPGKDGTPAPEPVLMTLKDDKGANIAGIILGRVKGFEVTSRPAEINVRRVGDAKSWLASVRLDPTPDPVDWMDRAMPKVRRDEVAEVLVSHGDGTTLRLFRDKPDAEGFTIDKMPAGFTVSAPFEVNAVAQALEFASLQDVRRYDAAAFEKAVLTTYRLKNGLELALRTVAEDGKFWMSAEIRDAAASDDEARKQAAELRKGYDGWAFQMTENLGRDLTRRMTDLIKKDEPAEKKAEKK